MSENMRKPIVKFASGRKTARDLRQLKRGRGKLVSQVDRQLLRVTETAGVDNIIQVPIVVHYEVESDNPFSFK